mmetsp:Transcript_158736/g.289447  ORF Transcript_158736/g.289447 Transcript_158736/m.289447 type:complete len:219 (-) Transcript_158736:109-765(-)
MDRADWQMKVTDDTSQALRGYGLEAVDVPGDLQCPVCMSPAFNGVVTTCEHAFHQECLQQSLRQRPQQCPSCRGRLKKGKEFSPIGRMIQNNVLSALVVHCPQRCGMQVTFEQLEAHVARDCVSTPFKCPHSGCNKIAPQDELFPHIETCVFAPQASATMSVVMPLLEKITTMEKKMTAMEEQKEKDKKKMTAMQKRMTAMEKEMAAIQGGQEDMVSE